MTDQSIAICTADITDLRTLQALGRETYCDHFSSLWSPQGLELFLEQHFSVVALAATLDRPQQHQWLIAYDINNHPIGFSKTNWAQADPINHIAGAELQKIYFCAAAAGMGLGEKLISFILQHAAEKEQPRLWLEVLHTNVKAQRFYERVGFSAIGNLPFSTDTHNIGMLVMAYQPNSSGFSRNIDG